MGIRETGTLRLVPSQLEMTDATAIAELVSLRAEVAQSLSTRHGPGPWSRQSTEAGVRFELRSTSLLVLRDATRIVACVGVTRRKPWAIDPRNFSPSRTPVYVVALAVAPAWQGRGVGRQCLAAAEDWAVQWQSDMIRLDAYDAPAGAGAFYQRCGYREVGRATYRKCPLVYFERALIAA
ncbi:MAG: GNAT family N-acetyltransferase [Opitutaceae bacterium]